MATLAELRQAGQLDGYRAGLRYERSHLVRAAYQIDRECCTDAVCERCGQKGLDYRPFFCATGRGYRPFAVCPACGEASEF